MNRQNEVLIACVKGVHDFTACFSCVQWQQRWLFPDIRNKDIVLTNVDVKIDIKSLVTKVVSPDYASYNDVWRKVYYLRVNVFPFVRDGCTSQTFCPNCGLKQWSGKSIQIISISFFWGKSCRISNISCFMKSKLQYIRDISFGIKMKTFCQNLFFHFCMIYRANIM